MTTWTNRGLLRLADSTFAPNNLELALLTATPSDATARDWNTQSDMTGEVTTGAVASYTRHALGTATITENDTADEAQIDYADTSFGVLQAGATVTAVAALDITSHEVMWVAALGTSAPTNGQTFTVVHPATGAAAVVHA